jgi:hypothetical protein
MTKPVDLVVYPVTNILRSISPSIKPESILDTLHVISLVATAIWPDLKSVSVLLISEPRSFVNCATLMFEFTVSMGFAKHPLTVVDFSSHVREHTLAVGLT